MTTTANEFLETVYDQLEYNSGQGYFRVTGSSNAPNLSQIGWFEQARQLGAETIYFVEDFPTVLFFKHDLDLGADTRGTEESIRQLFIQVWNTSRVPLFFVALPGELRVYSAYQKPIKRDDWLAEDRWLKRIETIAQVAELAEFSRPQVDSGHLFQRRSNDFNRDNRVDQWLLKNLRLLRQRLGGENRGKREHVHAVIGRSIFIRYLEDRKVLVEGYFTDLDSSHEYQSYIDVLVSKEDTYRLFGKLRHDFNGDLFPLSDEEESAIEETDLHLLGDFLLGRSMGDQPDLLFWAYKFDIIPIELISNIYEEFYHENSATEDKGTHYTPTSLVDFVLSQTLTTERLDSDARVLDAACGSGIFLVEAFKRMVYHRCRRQGVDRLSRSDLVELLTEKIVGFDINRSAIQIAAFSLYLAFLDFREPPDIRANKQLPKLICNPEERENSGKSLFHTNAFYLTEDEQDELKERITSTKSYAGKADDIRASQSPILPIRDLKFDIVVGNPPWGYSNSEDNQLVVRWCNAFRYPIGHKELSQCFLWRMKDFLTPQGTIGLLVHASILFKTRDNSRNFRKAWLKQNQVLSVYNFSHVRGIFFQQSIAPFAIVFYTPKHRVNLDDTMLYISIKHQAFIDQLQAVVIDRNEIHKVRQGNLLSNDWLWKTYMWGNLNDAELIGELLSCYQPLEHFVEEYGYGYQVRNHARKKSKAAFEVDVELPLSSFYNNRPIHDLLVPIKHSSITSLGNFQIYKGPRLIIRRGIPRSGPKLGEIQARLANIPFVFTDDIAGFRLDTLDEDKQTILLGILLSSLAKYYHFLTCSMWGLWHHKIHRNEHLLLPVSFPKDETVQNRIISAVNQIATSIDSPTLFDPDNPGWRAMQHELDEAIFDLYELSKAQRDLVRDLCQVTLEFFYEGTNAQAVKPPPTDWLESYTDTFVDIWQDRLAARGKELETRIFAPHNGLLVGMVFELVDLGTSQVHSPVTDNADWQRWFRRLSRSLLQERSSQIYIDRTIKDLTDSSMFIIKRAERRLWTKSMACQDAQELLTEVFRLEWQKNREPS